uniref:Uncharacterized protein n=1 Tax=Sphaerodactylus townsendi TaxID=933632 RepID=A0ACB8EJI5_9SAUR
MEEEKSRLSNSRSLYNVRINIWGYMHVHHIWMMTGFHSVISWSFPLQAGAGGWVSWVDEQAAKCALKWRLNLKPPHAPPPSMLLRWKINCRWNMHLKKHPCN